MRLDENDMRARRDKIMESAYQLFCKHGIDQVSMGHIATQSDVGNRTMYRYFNTKMDLVVEVLVYQWSILTEEIRNYLEYHSTYPSLTGYEQVARWLKAFRHIFETNVPVILFSYEAKLHVMRNRMHFTIEQKDFFTHGIRELFVAALEKGRVDGTLSIPDGSMEAFYAIWASIRGCIILCGENSPCKNTYEVMEKMILKSICSNETKYKGGE